MKNMVIVGDFIINIDTIRYEDLKLLRYIIPASAYAPLKGRKQGRLNRNAFRHKNNNK